MIYRATRSLQQNINLIVFGCITNFLKFLANLNNRNHWLFVNLSSQKFLSNPKTIVTNYNLIAYNFRVIHFNCTRLQIKCLCLFYTKHLLSCAYDIFAKTNGLKTDSNVYRIYSMSRRHKNKNIKIFLKMRRNTRKARKI